MKKANAKISWICFLFPKISSFPLKVIIMTFLDEIIFFGLSKKFLLGEKHYQWLILSTPYTYLLLR